MVHMKSQHQEYVNLTDIALHATYGAREMEKMINIILI